MPHEVSEHIEHAAHDPHQGSLPRLIGITIAILGVLMALCSAQVGAARTELIATMVEQQGAALRFQSVSTKYRMLQAQLQQLHALMPDPKVIAKANADLAHVKKEEMKSPDSLQIIAADELMMKKVLSSVIPSRDDVLRFAKLIRRHQEEAEAAEKWSESYKDAVEAHASTASHFEIAQVAAEIGIVIASVGLLLSNMKMFSRGAWIAAIALGVLSLTIATGTKIVNTRALHGAEEKIQVTEEHYKEHSKGDEDVAEDKKLIEEIEKDIEKLTDASE